MTTPPTTRPAAPGPRARGRALRCCAALAWAGTACTSPQDADLRVDTTVSRPAYAAGGPVVCVDEAHHNYHTTGGRYRAFAMLLASDGYRVAPGRSAFTAGALAACDVLVVANAWAATDPPDAPALAEAEAEALVRWVEEGGSLLLVADVYPFGGAVRNLARRLGVRMSEGVTRDAPRRLAAATVDSDIVFARRAGMLGEHPILRGRSAGERIDRVFAFSGQSLEGPPGSTPLLLLSATATDHDPAPGQDPSFALGLSAEYGPPMRPRGRAMGLAMEPGRGRVVVLGEAAMLSSQIVRGGERLGWNVPGSDNRQFTLNTLHWLSGLLP